MAAFLRRFMSHHLRDGILAPSTFFCNEGSLSFYDRSAPLDTVTGVREMRDHFDERENKRFGVFELVSEDLEVFGLHPKTVIDEEDPVYGNHHCESKCFEEIYLELTERDNVNRQLMNRKKAKLASIAQESIVVPPVLEARPPEA